MRLLLNILLFLSVLLACFIEDIYLFAVPPESNRVIPFTIRSQRQFDFDQEKALGGKREKALSQYVPIYAYVPYRAEEAKKELEALAQKVSALRDPELSGAQDLLNYIHTRFGLVDLSGLQLFGNTHRNTRMGFQNTDIG